MLGVKLAPICPDKEKAFEDSTKGTVLGVTFNSETLQWSITPQKVKKIMNKIQPVIEGIPPTLVQLQGLLGSLNDFAQMCPSIHESFQTPVM
jgi:hypothetical protein